MNISSINLNLLVAFAALFEERGVTGAPRRAGVTQPAMSNTLAQLRALFDDELFLRHRTGLTPTVRAQQLAVPIRQGLRLLEGALSEPRFEPGSSERRFVIMASDYVELVLLPPLLRRLARQAPGVRLELRPWGLHEAPPELARGDADLMLGFYGKLPPQHHEQRLLEDEYVCVVRRGHPRVKGKLTRKQRRVGARVSHFLSVPPLVARTDLVAALDRRVAEVFAKPMGLRLLPPPLKLPRGSIGQVWHQQHERDPAQRWLRQLISDVARELSR
jgi:DNA-binding transcriptional LysR family regulator